MSSFLLCPKRSDQKRQTRKARGPAFNVRTCNMISCSLRTHIHTHTQRKRRGTADPRAAPILATPAPVPPSTPFRLVHGLACQAWLPCDLLDSVDPEGGILAILRIANIPIGLSGRSSCVALATPKGLSTRFSRLKSTCDSLNF